MQALHRPVLVRAPETELWLERMAEYQNQSGFLNGSELTRFSNLDDIDLAADGTLELRIMISIVYAVVCAVGLVGNLLVFFLMKVRQGRKKSTINFFVLNLAVTDFQFVLALPFWAVENALDFSWPFGNAMCKIVLTVTVMNMYASVFFLTAMSVTRYWSVASALKDRTRYKTCSVKLVAALLWVLATVATTPTAIFASVNKINGVKLCLLRFPDGQQWHALYHLQKTLVAFVFPMLIITVCYLLLLRLIRQRSMNNNLPKRQSRVTKSVTVVVLSFFICWMPNHVITFWGVLVKFNMVQWDKMYYMIHTYVFPVTICLANVNSCLNPVLYCLMRREFRKMLKDFLWRISSPAIVNSCQIRPFSGTVKENDDSGVAIPLNVMETEQFRLSVVNASPSTDCTVTR
ncbi:relaxin-3 receptor 1 [Triplophysa rosa]|uniref:Relaxin-3 receptor 1 n=1 Tax=Triplophysa rosa TaxID=992332 RepID=A0A9W8C958_TRIRA|nr:relaxin-3 receptor 1 [Triplophysa rosa]KAI7811600.1 putative relaxin-3 receptor 1-like [Triplophysa rosa]